MRVCFALNLNVCAVPRVSAMKRPGTCEISATAAKKLVYSFTRLPPAEEWLAAGHAVSVAEDSAEAMGMAAAPWSALAEPTEVRGRGLLERSDRWIAKTTVMTHQKATAADPAPAMKAMKDLIHGSWHDIRHLPAAADVFCSAARGLRHVSSVAGAVVLVPSADFFLCSAC